MSINGANRLGSNSLVEILVFGRQAALSTIDYMQSGASPKTPAHVRLADAAQSRLRELFNRATGKETVAGLRQEMRRPWSSARASTATATSSPTV